MWTLNTIQSFSGSATGALALDAGGNLYGQLIGGGANGWGAVFKLSQSGNDWVYTVLHDFNNTDGGDPFGDVLLSNGTLYGVTEYGGPDGLGVAWELSH
jgi:hypothetical protein